MVHGILTLTVKNKSLVPPLDIQGKELIHPPHTKYIHLLESQETDRKLRPCHHEEFRKESGIPNGTCLGEVTSRIVPQNTKQSAGNQSEQQKSSKALSMKAANGSEAIPSILVNETAESS